MVPRDTPARLVFGLVAPDRTRPWARPRAAHCRPPCPSFSAGMVAAGRGGDWSEKLSRLADRGAPPSGSRGRRGERLQSDPVTERLQPPDRATLDSGAVAALEAVGPQLLIDLVASEQMVRGD